VDRNFHSDYFPMSEIDTRCVPRADGQPKHSVYLSVYRVLEHVPIKAIGSLYLATRDGRVLEVQPSKNLPPFSKENRMYQEICPIMPRVVSSLDPREFAAFMTNPNRSIHVPIIFFAELRLGDLAKDPEKGSTKNLPYSSIEHLRACVKELGTQPHKSTKTVDRIPPVDFPYRMVQNGFYLGNDKELVYYPMPSEQQLQTTHYVWWRSASL
jgi:hypothetical protein